MVKKRRPQRGVTSLLGKHSSASFLRSRTAVIGFLLILIWIGVFTGREWARRAQVESEIERIQQEIAQIETTSKELEETLKLFTQPETIELEARRRLNLARPGETVVVIPGEYREGRGMSVTEELVADYGAPLVVTKSGTGPLANLLAWWSYFFEE